MSSATTRWTAVPRRPPPRSGPSATRCRARPIRLLVRPGQELHGRAQAMGVAGVKPERLIDQLAHRRQPAIADERQPMGEPALLGEEADELGASSGLPPALKTMANTTHRRSPAVGRQPLRPVSGHRVLIVVIRPRRTQRGRDRERRSSRSARPSERETPCCCRRWSSSPLGRRAALAPDRGIGGERLDHARPDFRIVDLRAAVRSSQGALVRELELDQLVVGVGVAATHRQTDPPDVVAAQSAAHRRLDPIAPEATRTRPIPWECRRARSPRAPKDYSTRGDNWNAAPSAGRTGRVGPSPPLSNVDTRRRRHRTGPGPGPGRLQLDQLVGVGPPCARGHHVPNTKSGGSPAARAASALASTSLCAG